MAAVPGTGSDPKGDGSNQAVVPPGSQGEDGKAPGEESIPKSRFVAAINDVTRRLDTLATENRDLKAQLDAVKKPEPKVPTRAELAALVASGDLTQLQADEIRDAHLIAQAKREAAAEATNTVSVAAQTATVTAQLEAYREVVGAAWEAGSPEHAKAVKEYETLVGIGLPPSNETQLAALRSAFGDLETLRVSKTARAGSSDTHVETGGSRPRDGGESKSDGAPKGLSARQHDHYERLIRAGTYKGWDEVKAELAVVAPRRAR